MVRAVIVVGAMRKEAAPALACRRCAVDPASVVAVHKFTPTPLREICGFKPQLTPHATTISTRSCPSAAADANSERENMALRLAAERCCVGKTATRSFAAAASKATGEILRWCGVC